jgi:CBS domain-containing protein
LIVLPIAIVKGLRKTPKAKPQEALLPSMQPGWNALRHTPVADANIILNLTPVQVKSDTPLYQVASAMLSYPNVHVACVVNDAEQLVGLINLRALADDLFFHILPEEFIGEVTDMEQAMSFASKSKMRTAADAMDKPVWVKQDETVKDAFKRMHENGLPGLPVVNDLYHVTGYINLLELIALCMKGLDDSKNLGVEN